MQYRENETHRTISTSSCHTVPSQSTQVCLWVPDSLSALRCSGSCYGWYPLCGWYTLCGIRTSCFCPTHLCKSGSGCVLFIYFANRWQKLSHEQPAGVVDAHFFIEPIGRLDGVPTSDKTAARKGADAFGCWCANVEIKDILFGWIHTEAVKM
ncbi:Protein of unknown function [Gryllus bimaculatus]|nr:Protein of unknown function [Gryllus bimaculatus]